jgi:hypothetical protein
VWARAPIGTPRPRVQGRLPRLVFGPLRQRLGQAGDVEGDEVKDQQRVEGRQQAQCPAGVEPGEADRGMLLPLLQQQRGDQEAGEHEEQPHPHVAALEQRAVEMEQHHHGDGDTAQSVEGRDVTQTEWGRVAQWADCSTTHSRRGFAPAGRISSKKEAPIWIGAGIT